MHSLDDEREKVHFKPNKQHQHWWIVVARQKRRKKKIIKKQNQKKRARLELECTLTNYTINWWPSCRGDMASIGSTECLSISRGVCFFFFRFILFLFLFLPFFRSYSTHFHIYCTVWCEMLRVYLVFGVERERHFYFNFDFMFYKYLLALWFYNTNAFAEMLHSHSNADDYLIARQHHSQQKHAEPANRYWKEMEQSETEREYSTSNDIIYINFPKVIHF